MDIVEIAARANGAPGLESVAVGRALELPALGQIALAPDQLALGVRPGRWLLLSAPAAPGAAAAIWQAACAGVGAAVDLSSGLAGLHLGGPAAREILARACRLDLDLSAFPAGRAAATIMVQVSVVLAALPSGLLLLTPATTARHVREWLTSTGKPFGLTARADVTVASLCGDELT
ncbi:MAG: sarcosine oxidase subunit gamma family protein [Steroidobacteraceae bacterium]